MSANRACTFGAGKWALKEALVMGNDCNERDTQVLYHVADVAWQWICVWHRIVRRRRCMSRQATRQISRIFTKAWDSAIKGLAIWSKLRQASGS